MTVNPLLQFFPSCFFFDSQSSCHNRAQACRRKISVLHVVSVPQQRRRSMCSVTVFAQGFASWAENFYVSCQSQFPWTRLCWRSVLSTIFVTATLAVLCLASASDVVVVSGATGRTGSLIDKALKDQNVSVRGFIRNVTKGRERL